MPEPLEAALAEIRTLLLDPARLVHAIAAGRRRGAAPALVRAELRPVALKAGRRLQVVRDDGTRPRVTNVQWGAPAEAVVDELLTEPFGNWHVRGVEQVLQLRVTKRGAAQLHRAATVPGRAPGGPSAATPQTDGAEPPALRDDAHDRPKAHLLDPGDPLYDVIGGGAAKRRQVDAFLRALDATLGTAGLPHPLRVADLGCGNAYLTFAAYRYLTGRGLDVRVTGVDVRDDQRVRNTALAQRLGCGDRVRFVAGTIAEAELDADPHVVLALHACDTATDEALARAVKWRATWVLAAPCCHHDIAAQLRRSPAPPAAPAAPTGDSGSGGRSAQRALVRDGVLRERFADVLTDALRAALLRLHGYRVEVVEFVASQHTPRNVLLRARRTGSRGTPAQRTEYAELAETWGVTPALARLLSRPPDQVRAAAPVGRADSE